MARELAMFGEQVYPVFVNDRRHGAHRLHRPEDHRAPVTDPDNRSQPIGVVTKKDDKGRFYGTAW
jgi:hypothetical protein